MMSWKVLAAMAAGVIAISVLAGRADEPSTRPTTESTADKPLPADQLIGQMLRPAGPAETRVPDVVGPPARDMTSGGGAVAPHAPAQSVLREGTYLVDRTGRITRSADGSQAEFRFDSDRQGLRDPPVIILPNLKLMAMEGAVGGTNRDLRFRITGLVTEYRGRNYVLLEKVVVVPDVTQQF